MHVKSVTQMQCKFFIVISFVFFINLDALNHEDFLSRAEQFDLPDAHVVSDNKILELRKFPEDVKIFYFCSLKAFNHKENMKYLNELKHKMHKKFPEKVGIYIIYLDSDSVLKVRLFYIRNWMIFYKPTFLDPQRDLFSQLNIKQDHALFIVDENNKVILQNTNIFQLKTMELEEFILRTMEK